MKQDKSNQSGRSASGLRIRTKSGWKLEKGDIKKVTGQSMTINDQALTIRQLMSKFSHGIDLGRTQEGVYIEGADLDDEDLSKVDGLDLYEKQELSEINQDKFVKGKVKAEGVKAERLKAEAEAKAQEEREKLRVSQFLDEEDKKKIK